MLNRWPCDTMPVAFYYIRPNASDGSLARGAAFVCGIPALVLLSSHGAENIRGSSKLRNLVLGSNSNNWFGSLFLTSRSLSNLSV